VVFIRLTPDCLALRLYAANRTKYGYRTIQYAKTTLDLYREIDMSRRIDYVYAVTRIITIPVANRRRTRNRNAAFLLFSHPVHRRSAIMHLPDPVRPAGKIQYSLRRRRLSCINVRHDSYVAHTT
jgi:hypothetical protein